MAKIAFQMEPIAVGISQAAKLIGCSPQYVRLLVRKRQLQASRSGRKVFIEVAMLKKFLEERRMLA